MGARVDILALDPADRALEPITREQFNLRRFVEAQIGQGLPRLIAEWLAQPGRIDVGEPYFDLVTFD